MPFKAHIRRLTHSSRSSSSSTSTYTSNTSSPLSSSPTSGTSTPLSSSPSSTHSSNLSSLSTSLSKTSSRLSLSKTLTWTTKGKARKREKQLMDWERYDAEEWRMPKCSGRKGGRGRDVLVQEVVRGWNMDFGQDPIHAVRSASLYGGVSPCTSRLNSLDGGSRSGAALQVQTPSANDDE